MQQTRKPGPQRALVLAGGGAKGSYQVGVWQALQELGWTPDIITGASVGALNGCLFTMGKSKEAEDLWRRLEIHDVLEVPDSLKPEELNNFFLDVVRSGGLNVEPLAETIDRLIDEDAVRRCPKAESFVATPDGLGNVSSVDILREQVLVRLDGQNEGPKRYRTCEIQVLRNGKGSRDGIELPMTLPERYQEPPEEPQLTLNFFSSAKAIVPPEQWTAPVAKADAPATDEEEKEKRRSRRGGRGHRGGRGRGKGHAEGGEKAEAQEKNAESRSEKPQRSEKANGGRRERPARSAEKNGERRAPRQNKPKKPFWLIKQSVTTLKEKKFWRVIANII